MSEVTAVNLDALTQRVEKLEQLIAEQITPRFDDVQDNYASALSRIDDYFSRTQKAVTEAQKAVSDAHNELTRALAELRDKFNDRVREEIAKATSADIAEALTKKILVTRRATQAELRDPTSEILKFRHATSAEINQQ